MTFSDRAAEHASLTPPHLRRRPAAVLLDAGNTLLHLDYELLASMLSRAASAMGGGSGHEVALTPETVRRAEWRSRVRLDTLLETHSTESVGTFRSYMTLLSEESGLTLEPAALASLLDELADYQQAHNLWRHPHPFAKRVLAELRAEGCRLGVISNAAGDVSDLLARHDLAGSLDSIVDSSRVGVEKPDPAIFRLALRELGIQPDDAIHVGDLPAVDVAGARAAGIDPVLIDPLGSWLQVDCVKIRDITALPELVRRAPRPL
jgi:HAD superfamily hydrolase (TIGR01509 family)